MASQIPGGGRADRAGSDDFESGLDYGAFVEDDADTTQALPRQGGTDRPGAGDNPTLVMDRGGIAAAGGSGAGAHAADGREDIAFTRETPATAAAPAGALGGTAARPTVRQGAPVGGHAPDRYPGDAAAAPAGVAGSRAVDADGPTPEEQARLPKAGPRIAQVLLAVLAPLTLLLGAVRLVASPLFLWLEYHRPGFPADDYGFTTADRMHYGSAGLDYLSNAAGSRYLSSLMHEGQPLFTAAEVSHMTDVKIVMLAATAALVVLALVCAALAWYLHRTSPGGVRRALFAGAVWLLIALVVLGVLAATGWETFFAGFHSLFFADGTWTFSTADSLIRLYPGQFWVDAAFAVAVLTLAGALLALVLGWPSRRRRELTQDRRAQLEATRLRWAREDAYGAR